MNLKDDKQKKNTESLMEQYKAEVNFKLQMNVTFQLFEEIKQPEASYKLITDIDSDAIDTLISVVKLVNERK